MKQTTLSDTGMSQYCIIINMNKTTLSRIKDGNYCQLSTRKDAALYQMVRKAKGKCVITSTKSQRSFEYPAKTVCYA